MAAKSIEGLSKRVEQAVCNMLEVFKLSYEKVREGSRPRKRINKNNEETPEEVSFLHDIFSCFYVFILVMTWSNKLWNVYFKSLKILEN